MRAANLTPWRWQEDESRARAAARKESAKRKHEEILAAQHAEADRLDARLDAGMGVDPMSNAQMM